MRHIIAQARLEHAEALRHPKRPAIAIGQVDHAAAPLGQRAGAPRQQHQSEQAEIAGQEIFHDTFQHLLLGRGADLPRSQIFRPPLLGLAVVDDAAAALVEAEHRQRRNQYRGGEQERRGALEPGAHPQPEIKPDAAVGPGDQQQRIHLQDLVRPHHPIGIEHLRVELFMAEQGLAEPHAGDVGDDQRGDAQAEHELQRLDRLPAEFPALIQRPDPEAGMNQRGGVEGDRDREELPEHGVVVDPGGQRIHRDIAERMVEEMADQIGKHHQPAGQPNLTDADAADEVCQPFLGEPDHAIRLSSHRE